jgi:DNA-binding response OmpR family regulator
MEIAMPERLLVVDDDQAITQLLRRGFSYEGYSVATALSGEQALSEALAPDDPPDLVILDIMMPGIDGLEVCRQLRRERRDLPILLLTARDSPADEIAGLDLGGDDYVTKPFDFDVLHAHVRALLRQRREDGPATLQHGDLRLDTGARVACRGGRTIDLTTTEYKLLHFFLSCPQQVLTKEQILQHVWGYDFGGNVNVVD